MSTTNLELRQELPKLQIPTIRIITNPAIETPISGSNDDGCYTPTSTEHKIPAILSCPPAPKKPRRTSIFCKRKLCELDFFETVAREEVEPCFVYVNAYHVLKMRRCRVCGQILPAFCQLSNKFPKLSFVYADIDECPETTQNIRYTPTFHFYQDGERVDEMFGGGEERLHDRLWLHS